LNSAAESLALLLAPTDVPSWLRDITNQTLLFSSGSWDTFSLISNLIPSKAQLSNHQWAFDGAIDGYDFDALFNHYRRESRLPELLLETIRTLEQIRDSGEIDSLTMLNALGRIIATLKRGNDGSYLSLHGAYSFLMTFLRNYMWEELIKIPALGSALTALKKTVGELEEEMADVHGSVQKEIQNVIEAEIRPLGDRAKFTFITYDRSGKIAQ